MEEIDCFIILDLAVILSFFCDTKSTSNKSKSRQMEHQTKKLLHSKGNKDVETAYRLGENICKLPLIGD